MEALAIDASQVADAIKANGLTQSFLCDVSQVADAIKTYGLTLANYASVREQTIGGFTQVAAHGTGTHLSTVDDQVIAMRLVTPSKGTLTLSKASLRPCATCAACQTCVHGKERPHLQRPTPVKHMFACPSEGSQSVPPCQQCNQHDPNNHIALHRLTNYRELSQAVLRFY